MARFEGSAKDRAEDAKQAKKHGMSKKAWENSAADKKLDAAGERRSSKKPPPRRQPAPAQDFGLATPPGGDPMMGGGEDMGGF